MLSSSSPPVLCCSSFADDEHGCRASSRETRVPLQTVEPRRLYRQIADQIARLIEAGEFARGARLPAERELAPLIGVPRTSVRAAPISHEIAGLVEVRVGTGIFVTGGPTPASAVADKGPGPFEL